MKHEPTTPNLSTLRARSRHRRPLPSLPCREALRAAPEQCRWQLRPRQLPAVGSIAGVDQPPVVGGPGLQKTAGAGGQRNAFLQCSDTIHDAEPAAITEPTADGDGFP